MGSGSHNLGLLSECARRKTWSAILRMAGPTPGKDLKGEILFHDQLVVMDRDQQKPQFPLLGVDVAMSNFTIWWTNLDCPPPNISPWPVCGGRIRARGIAVPRSFCHHVFGSYAANMWSRERDMAMLQAPALVPNLSWVAEALPIELPETRSANRSGPH